MIPFAAPAEIYSEWIRNMIENGPDAPFPDPGGKERPRTLTEGDLMLSVPVAGGAASLKRKYLTNPVISGHGRWQDVHLGALKAAYGKAPYFIHFFPALEEIYGGMSTGSLEKFNLKLHQTVCDGLGLDPVLIEMLREMPTEDLERLRRIGGEKRRIINMKHSILEVLFRLGKEGMLVLI